MRDVGTRSSDGSDSSAEGCALMAGGRRRAGVRGKSVMPETLARRVFFFFQAEDGIRDLTVTGVQTCALPISKLLAPLSILGSRRDVIQDFYMYFAKGLYKWELAQYFTPTEVVDCVVVLNPQPGEHIKDPACGSSDFLISTLRWADRPPLECVPVHLGCGQQSPGRSG